MNQDCPAPGRVVFCEDAIAWLENSAVLSNCSLVTSLPDISEFPKFSVDQWKDWFSKTAALVISKTPDDGVTIFYQTDIKLGGVWIDKGYLCQKAAEDQGTQLVWHKIICRSEPGQATFGRTGYTHLLCFSKTIREQPKASTADVVPDLGEKTWEKGMGLKACWIIGNFIKDQTRSTTIVNPFCGQGSMLAVANTLNLLAIGIERSPKRAEIARELRVETGGKRWANGSTSFD